VRREKHKTVEGLQRAFEKVLWLFEMKVGNVQTIQETGEGVVNSRKGHKPQFEPQLIPHQQLSFSTPTIRDHHPC